MMLLVGHVLHIWVSELCACHIMKKTQNQENQITCPGDSMLLTHQEEKRGREVLIQPLFVTKATPTRGVTKLR